LTRHFGTLDEGRTKSGAVASKKENFVERNLVASSAFELFNSKKIAFGDSVLLAAGADNCMCHGEGPRKLDCPPGWRKELGALSLNFFRGGVFSLSPSSGYRSSEQYLLLNQRSEGYLGATSGAKNRRPQKAPKKRTE